MTEEEKYCEEMRDMFLTAGWKNLMEEMTDASEAMSDIGSVNTLEQLHFNKGQVAVLAGLLALEEEIKQAEADEEGIVH